MLSRFLSWLGLEQNSDPAPRVSRPPQRRSATGHLYQKKSAPSPQKSRSAAFDNDFNPYNTGQFDRSASWDKISKSQR
jgi:hypothetical protein